MFVQSILCPALPIPAPRPTPAPAPGRSWFYPSTPAPAPAPAPTPGFSYTPANTYARVIIFMRRYTHFYFFKSC